MKISFGIIVVNGEPWIKPVLESLYKHAHAICIAEGATANWRDANGFITPRSTDKTLDIIRNFPDPNKKIRIVASDSFYTEKLEQCNAWLNLVPSDTDYIWEVDADEFYHDRDIELMKKLLEQHQFTYVEFPVYNFFKGFDYYGTGGTGWGYDVPFPRIFKYYPGCRWANHRPPTICDRNGTDYRNIKPLPGNKNPVRMYHYSYVTNRQTVEKLAYYTKIFGKDYFKEWYEPFYKSWNYHNRTELEVKYSAHPSRPGAVTKRFDGKHPDIISKYFKIINKDVIIRIDDFPTGIRPILQDITPLVRILEFFCHNFKNVNLGIVPVLFTKQMYDMIRHLDIEPCMHGYDHHYAQYSPVLVNANDMFNKQTVMTQFNEFENNSLEQIRLKIGNGKKKLEDTFQKTVKKYIPPCNIIDGQTLHVLKEYGMSNYENSDFYGRVLEMDTERNYKSAAFHLTWEFDDLTWKGKSFEKWITALHMLRGFDEDLV